MRAPSEPARRGILAAIAFAESHNEDGRVGSAHDLAEAASWLEHQLPHSTTGNTLRYWRKKLMEAV